MEALLSLLTLSTVLHTTLSGILYPRESESREVVSLGGIWKFRTSPTDDQEKGFENKWYSTNFEEVSE
jgi:beta-glucuronidase